MPCEVCGNIEIVGVASVPGVPYSAAYCRECLKANAHPWNILVAQVACIDGYDNAADYLKEMVTCTCERLGKTLNDFLGDVNIALKSFE